MSDDNVVTPKKWAEEVKKRIAEYDGMDYLEDRIEVDASYDPKTKRISVSVIDPAPLPIVIRQVK